MIYLRVLFLVLILAPMPQSVHADVMSDAVAAYKSGDYSTAIRLLQSLAKRGNTSAQYNLGFMYQRGRGVSRDAEKAISWFLKAAIRGHAKAQNNLGNYYNLGLEVAEDKSKAIYWFRKAANQGNVWSQHSLGSIYANGSGVARNYVLAHMWYDIAASSGKRGSEDAGPARNKLAQKMNSSQIVEAQDKAREWMIVHQR